MGSYFEHYTPSSGTGPTYEIEYWETGYKIRLNGKALKEVKLAGQFGNITGAEACRIHAISAIEHKQGIAENAPESPSVDIEPTQDEMEALKGIGNAGALGIETATTPNLSKRLVDHGYVTKDDTGHLILTVKGKRLLRPGPF